MLAQCVLLLTLLMADHEAFQDPSAGDPTLLPEHEQQIQRFCGLLGLRYERRELLGPGWSRIGLVPSLLFRLGPNGPRIVLAPTGETVFFYQAGFGDVPTDDKSQRPMQEEMTAERAFEVATPFLRFFCQPEEEEAYSIAPDVTVPSTVGNGRWRVHRKLEYQGFECVASELSIFVRTLTRRVELIIHFPPLPPMTPARIVTPEVAMDAARQWTPDVGEFPSASIAFDKDVVKGLRKVLLPPSYWKDDFPTVDDENTARWCWAIPCRIQQTDPDTNSLEVIEFRIFVDVETGKVLN